MTDGYEMGSRPVVASKASIEAALAADVDPDLVAFVKAEGIQIPGRPDASPEEVVRQMTRDYLTRAVVDVDTSEKSPTQGATR